MILLTISTFICTRQRRILTIGFRLIAGMNSRQDTSPTDSTLCSSESPIFVGPAAAIDLSSMYDQHSSEEELEVINGPLSESPTNVLRTPPSVNRQHSRQSYKTDFGGAFGVGSNGDTNSPKRCCSSTLLEKRKRSLAHSSDDEVRICHAPFSSGQGSAWS